MKVVGFRSATLFRRKCSPPPTTECLSLYELQDNNGPLAQDHSVRTPFMPCVGNLEGFRSMQNGPLRQTRTNVGDKCGSQRLKPDNTTTIQHHDNTTTRMARTVLLPIHIPNLVHISAPQTNGVNQEVFFTLPDTNQRHRFFGTPPSLARIAC